jgi:hypothetical protein
VSAPSHTPGPWRSTGADCKVVSDGEKEWNPGLNLTGPAFIAAVGGHDPLTAVANARLIAAAPDLLDALESARLALMRYGQFVPNNERDSYAHACNKASAALARATGGGQ